MSKLASKKTVVEIVFWKLILLRHFDTSILIIMNRRGFTLIEVLVSVAILAFIMASVWASTGQSLDAKERFERRDGIYQEGRVALRKLTDDFTMAFLAKSQTPGTVTTEGAAATPMPAEISTRPRPITFFIGEDNAERDEVRFTSLSNLRLFKNAKESEQCKVSYAVEPSKEDPKVMNLVRTFSPVIDDKDTVVGTSYVIAEDIREFSVEYYDQRKLEWVKTWNTVQLDWKDRLPRAVRITLSFPDPDEEKDSIVMTTAAMLPLSTGPIDF